MKLEQLRPNVFRLTVASQELSALVAAARLARDAMMDDPNAPPEALRLLDSVLDDFDRARERLRDDDGREPRPS